MSPERVYWISFAAFAVAATVSIGLDVVTGTVGIPTAAAACVALVFSYVAAVGHQNPERVNIPTDWGPQVYLTVTVACFFLFVVAIELYGLIA
ncbi:hypothetical protein [Haloferax sp. DFSO60]|uniref:hypothetical protein n=1 Tax=Haloferax sp. DFSO60 TaxID=3388652 RepID=UPI00397A11BD